MKPRTALTRALAAAFGLAVLLGAPSAFAAAEGAEEPVLVGPLTRERIEAEVPGWAEAVVAAELDAEAAEALAAVEPGAEVTVFLGTWCSDSRREVPRFWRALDAGGGLVPFEIELVGVDRDKREPADRVSAADVRYVPTFVVRRGGREVGRVVEGSPEGIERDLLDLLAGRAAGTITTRDDLSDPGAPGGGR
jgi:hypothetical protein